VKITLLTAGGRGSGIVEAIYETKAMTADHKTPASEVGAANNLGM
jgi:hypothetical protein